MVLAFRFRPLPVRVHLWFLVVAAFLGLTLQHTPLDVALWGCGLLVAAFAHELAHALAARAFGVAAGVEMTPMGGAIDRRIGELSHGRRVIVSLAGPLASISLGAVLGV